jgi:hypothetical protein
MSHASPHVHRCPPVLKETIFKRKGYSEALKRCARLKDGRTEERPSYHAYLLSLNLWHVDLQLLCFHVGPPILETQGFTISGVVKEIQRHWTQLLDYRGICIFSVLISFDTMRLTSQTAIKPAIIQKTL